MSTKADRPTDDWILLARTAYPGEKARKLARRWMPDATERDLRRLASVINRVFAKHPEAPVEASATPAAPDEPEAPADDAPVSADDAYLAKLQADLEEARSDMRLMRSGKVFGPIPPMLKKVREMEAEVTAIRKAKEQTHASDIDQDFVVAELRKLPKALLRRALANE